MSTCLALDSTLLRWHDELRLGGIAPDGCAALKLVCCEAQHLFCLALGNTVFRRHERLRWTGALR